MKPPNERSFACLESNFDELLNTDRFCDFETICLLIIEFIEFIEIANLNSIIFFSSIALAIVKMVKQKIYQPPEPLFLVSVTNTIYDLCITIDSMERFRQYGAKDTEISSRWQPK